MPNRFMGTDFGERLKLSFGTSESLEKQQQIERQLGLKGKLDIGDVADVAGGALPFIGSILGAIGASPTALVSGPVGPVAGAGIGAAAGEAVRQNIGHVLGVRDDATPVSEAFRPIVSGLTTSAGFALGGKIGEKVLLPAKNAVTKILPQRLMSRIFKTSQDDFMQLMRTETISNLQKENPELFGKFVEQGIIKHKGSGAFEVNPTLQQELLERGLWGSPEGMIKYSFSKMFQLESTIRGKLKGMAQRLVLPEKNKYINLLNQISKEFGGRSFMSEKGAEAKILITKLKNATGNKMDPMDVLELRRFLDSMRNSGSFKLNPNLAPKQEEYKIAANKARTQLATIPEIAEAMNEYRIWIEAIDHLGDHAVRTSNKQLLGWMDALFAGGGAAVGAPGGGIGIPVLMRLFNSSSFQTGAAKALHKVSEKQLPEIIRQGAKYKTGDVIKSAIGGMLNE